jgi:hypothetical protein
MIPVNVIVQDVLRLAEITRANAACSKNKALVCGTPVHLLVDTSQGVSFSHVLEEAAKFARLRRTGGSAGVAPEDITMAMLVDDTSQPFHHWRDMVRSKTSQANVLDPTKVDPTTSSGRVSLTSTSWWKQVLILCPPSGFVIEPARYDDDATKSTLQWAGANPRSVVALDGVYLDRVLCYVHSIIP